jgi:hypothetical protein
MLNPDLGAVIVNEGFGQHSRHDAPVLRSLMASMESQDKPDSALALAVETVQDGRISIELINASTAAARPNMAPASSSRSSAAGFGCTRAAPT